MVDRGGEPITLRPKQLVLATGMSGKPNVPRIKGMDMFTGDQHHSSRHPGPDGYAGKTGRGHRLEQFRARYLRGALGSRRRRHHGAALLDPHRQIGFADGARPRSALFRAGGLERA